MTPIDEAVFQGPQQATKDPSRQGLGKRKPGGHVCRSGALEVKAPLDRVG